MSEAVVDTSNSIDAPLPWQLEQWQQLSRGLKANTLAHAYLVSGTAGLGKALFAHSFANYAICSDPVTGDQGASVACGECSNCSKSVAGSHPDYYRVAPEEGSKNIKIDQIRLLSEFVIRSSHSGGAKIAVIEEAHLLNANAANALLKTLEEPNQNTHLLLVSDHPGRLVATIRSRCQKLAFQIPSRGETESWLKSFMGGTSTEAVIQASDGRPLIALELMEGDSLQERNQLLQSLSGLQHGKKSISQVISQASKIGESEVLRYLSAFLAKLIKYNLTGVDEDSELNELYSLLDPVDAESVDERKKAQPVAAALTRFYGEVETARRQLASSTNPNPQLIMETILWRWSKIALK